MTLASIASHFQANSLGQPTKSADPLSAAITPPFRQLMKKTSAGTEKVARLVCCDLAVSLFPSWRVLMRQGWLVPRPGGDDGQDGPSHSIASLAASGDITHTPPPPPYTHCSTSSQPSAGVWYFHHTRWWRIWISFSLKLQIKKKQQHKINIISQQKHFIYIKELE